MGALSRFAFATFPLLLVTLWGCSCGSDDEPAKSSSGGSGGVAGSGGVGGDPAEFAAVEKSCAYHCPPLGSSCAEVTTPYACQNLGAWDAIPHADTCGSWDGSYPAPVPGKCSASAPSGEAALYAGPDPASPSTHILPDGRRLAPAGSLSLFTEPELLGGLTVALALVPGTTLVLSVDAGSGVHVVRAVDTALVGQQESGRELGSLRQAQLSERQHRLRATRSGAGRHCQRPGPGAEPRHRYRPARARRRAQHPLAERRKLTPISSRVSRSRRDGKRLAVSGVNDDRAIVVDLTPGTSYGVELGETPVGGEETFGIYFDPNDAEGKHAWVSLWKSASVSENRPHGSCEAERGAELRHREEPSGHRVSRRALDGRGQRPG